MRLEDLAVVGGVLGIPIGVAAASLLAQTKPIAKRVEVMGVDETKPFTVTIIGEPLARISTLKICCIQPDGTWGIFDILAGEVPSAVPGAGNLKFRRMEPMPFRPSDVAAINDGVDGNIFIRVTDDTGAEILYVTGWVKHGYALFLTSDTIFDMPYRDYALTVEVGH